MNEMQAESTGQFQQSAAVPQYKSADPRRKSAALAAFFSLVPGLGQVYVGYYQRGFINVLIMGAVVSFLSAPALESSGVIPLAGMFVGFFYLHNVIDAYRRAVLYNLSLDGIANMPLPDDFSSFDLRGSYVGGIAILAFGLIALSNTAFGFSLDWLESWWPMVPVIFGAYLVFRAYQDANNTSAEAVGNTAD